MHYFLIFFLASVIVPINSDISSAREELREEDWRHIDEHVLQTLRLTELRVERLADYFLEVAETDAEKARAIYRWITDRIRFDVETFFKGDLQAVTGQEVLHSRKAVCSGYTVLFKELARAMDLEVKIIKGHSKGYGFEPGNTSTLPVNHSWIAARIEGEWQLLDPTWGAGHIVESTRTFKLVFSEFYFLAKPEQLIFTHLPKDEKWQLLERPITEAEYLELAMVSPYFFQHGINFLNKTKLYTETDGDFSTRFTVPENIGIKCVVTHRESGQRESSLIQFEGERLDISTKLTQTGEYKLELFAREVGDGDEPFKRVVYFFLNNASPSTGKTYPRLSDYYELSRASLASPLQYELTDNLSYDFKIIIPGAEEAYVSNEKGEWYVLERDGQVFYGSVIPGPGKIELITGFSGDEFYWVLARFKGVK